MSQLLGYIRVGDKLDPSDWKDNPRPTAEQITMAVMQHLPPCDPDDQRCGNIMLLHDGGGNRAETVRALPMIIRALRARGVHLLSVSNLLGKTRDNVRPPLSAND